MITAMRQKESKLPFIPTEPRGCMRQFLLGTFLCALIIPTLSQGQTKQLTEQLGKTVLYGDVALSPDGSRVAWVQSTAATTPKQTYIQSTTGDAPVIPI